jgi:hypothetical protein
MSAKISIFEMRIDLGQYSDSSVERPLVAIRAAELRWGAVYI